MTIIGYDIPPDSYWECIEEDEQDSNDYFEDDDEQEDND